MQIYEYYRHEIGTGNIEQGTKLPSIRELTNRLNVSKNTVNEAYQQLLAEGYIESKQKKGYWVVKLEEKIIFPDKKKLSFHYPVIAEKNEEKVIDFQYGDIDLCHFPLKAWKKNMTDSIDSLEKEVMLYGDKMGYFPLRAEISKYLYEARGINCSPYQIVIKAGTQYAIKQILPLLGASAKKIAMENPGYDGVRRIFEKEGCTLVDIPVTVEAGYSMESLKKSNSDLAYVTPSHQFPLGKIMPIVKRMQLLQWADANQTYIIEDDYDSEFRYEGAPIPSLKGLDLNDRVIYLGTFSKAFLPSVRVSYMVMPERLVRNTNKEQLESQAASPIMQKALSLFIGKGEFERHLRKMRKLYEEKRTILVQSIQKRMGRKVEIIGENAGLHLLIVIKGGNTDKLCEIAKRNKINVYSAEKYYWKETKGETYPIILGFGGLTIEEIKEGISLLAHIWFEQTEEIE